MLLLLFGGGAPTNTIAFTTQNATVAVEGRADPPGPIVVPRHEYIWAYAIDAVKIGVIS